MTPKWIWKLTGGRPMKFIRAEFYDHIVNRDVCSFMDKQGRFWFAFGPWTWGRLRMRGDQIMATLHREKQDFSLLNESPSGMISLFFGPREHHIADYTTVEIGDMVKHQMNALIDEIELTVVRVGNGHRAPNVHKVVRPPSP